MEAFEGNGLGGIVEIIVAFQDFRVLFIAHGSGRSIWDDPDVSSKAIYWEHSNYFSDKVVKWRIHLNS